MTAIVSISGGKDSTATALLALDRYGQEDVRLVMADTGHEHPMTMEYVRDYLPERLGVKIDILHADFSRQIAGKRQFIARNWEYMGVPLAQVDRALELLHPTGNPYLDLCMWKGRFPSRMAQFCTQELKRIPLDEYHVHHNATESWQGIRRDESAARRDALAYEPACLDRPWAIVRPIVEWTAQQTIDFVRDRGVDLNPLYSLGQRRVGCMPCINCTKDELRETADRFPEQIARVQEWQRLVAAVAKRGATTFFPNLGIVEAVAWSRTSRGGKQFDLERFMPSEQCSSLYGLCE